MLFGTSGIRGLYGKDVDERLALRIANLFADKDVVVARDTRNTGESLAFAAISGILGQGKNAIYLGIAPTPTLALATEKRKCKGMMITASHNLPEYNGIKLYDNGKEIGRITEKEIEKKYDNGSGKTRYCNWNECGKRINDNGNALREHANLIKKIINTRAVAAKKPKVVVDCNGAGAVLTPDLLKGLGCEVVSINDGLSEFSAARASEPNSENLKGLAVKVHEVRANLGIGHDGDADRAVVVDEKGEVLALDVQLAIMIEYELEKNKTARKTKKSKIPEKPKIISTVEASLCIREVVEGAGAELVITPVGSNYVSEAMAREGAVFGGEPCGEYVFTDGLDVPDGILTAAKFVEIFCEKGVLSKLKNKYRTYPIIRDKFKCEKSDKYEVVEQIKKLIKSKTKPNEKIRDDDGLRIDEKDGWFLIRASGTEPYVRLTAEYKDLQKLEKRKKELQEIINAFV